MGKCCLSVSSIVTQRLKSLKIWVAAVPRWRGQGVEWYMWKSWQVLNLNLEVCFDNSVVCNE